MPDWRLLQYVDRTPRLAAVVASFRATWGPGAATVTIGPRSPTSTVPPSFLGISTEYWALPLFDRHLNEFARFLELLHPPGTGPFSLRVGGDSTDHAVFDVDTGRWPRRIVDLDPGWFHQMSALVGR